MTSPKRRLKEQNQLICDSDQGGGKKSENFADIIYGSPPSGIGFSLQKHTGRLREFSFIFRNMLRKREKHKKRMTSKKTIFFRGIKITESKDVSSDAT